MQMMYLIFTNQIKTMLELIKFLQEFSLVSRYRISQGKLEILGLGIERELKKEIKKVYVTTQKFIDSRYLQIIVADSVEDFLKLNIHC